MEPKKTLLLSLEWLLYSTGTLLICPCDEREDEGTDGHN